MRITSSKIILAFLLIILFLNLSLAQDNLQYNNNSTNFIYSQSTYICYPSNQTNNTILGECLTFTIYGLEKIDENLNNNDYIYDEEQNIYWLKQGISLHLIFHNDSYDLGITNISYEEYIDVKNKIIYYFETNGTIYNETYYYANGKLIAKKDNSGNKFFYHPDHLGSTTLVTDKTGNIVEEEFYLPHGDTYSGLELSRYLYTSKELDKLADLYYYGARYYQASVMRMFIQPDSIISDIYNPQSLNRYSYVLNNPYKYVDSSGNYIETALDVAFIGYDIYSIVQNPSDSSNYIALGLDVVGAALPVATGLGAGFRVAKGVGKAVDKVDDVADVAKAGEKAGDAGKGIENVGNKIADLKSFTKSNFRENVLKQTGESGIGKDIHHNLPQAKEFSSKFKEAGINVHNPNFGSVVERSQHRQTAYEYNKQFREFFDKNAKTTKEQIFNKAREISNKFEFKPRF